MQTTMSVAVIGWDSHRRFSQLTLRDAEARVIQRRRIEHADRLAFRETLGRWPAGTPVVLEATFGWSWITDELLASGHQPALASSKKMCVWRKARGLAKTNRLDADLLSEMPFEKHDWWRVWLAGLHQPRILLTIIDRHRVHQAPPWRAFGLALHGQLATVGQLPLPTLIDVATKLLNELLFPEQAQDCHGIKTGTG